MREKEANPAFLPLWQTLEVKKRGVAGKGRVFETEGGDPVAVKRVIRKAIWVLAGVAVLAVIAGIVVALSLDSIVKTGINTVGPRVAMGEIMKGLQTAEPQPRQKTQKRMRIGLVKVLGAKVSVAGLPAVGSVGLPAPDIQVSNVGTGGQGATPQEVASRTLSAIYEAVVGAVGSVLSADQLNALKGGLSDALKAGQNVLEEGGNKVKDAAGRVQKGIESILK